MAFAVAPGVDGTDQSENKVADIGGRAAEGGRRRGRNPPPGGGEVGGRAAGLAKEEGVKQVEHKP
ncbi:hypothetical protein U1Q18_032330 [Sarracenia purpurea var. burkii]